MSPNPVLERIRLKLVHWDPPIEISPTGTPPHLTLPHYRTSLPPLRSPHWDTPTSDLSPLLDLPLPPLRSPL